MAVRALPGTFKLIALEIELPPEVSNAPWKRRLCLTIAFLASSVKVENLPDFNRPIICADVNIVICEGFNPATCKSFQTDINSGVRLASCVGVKRPT